MPETIRFNDAIALAARILERTELPAEWRSLIVRDVHGRIRLAVDTDGTQRSELLAALERELQSLGAFAGHPALLLRASVFEPRALFEDPSILLFQMPGTDSSVRLLDRQVTGQDWQLKSSNARTTVPRMVFFGLKGGVGRSTALALVAFQLARAGMRVLALDLDLESPGLSGLMMPPDRLRRFRRS